MRKLLVLLFISSLFSILTVVVIDVDWGQFEANQELYEEEGESEGVEDDNVVEEIRLEDLNRNNLIFRSMNDISSSLFWYSFAIKSAYQQIILQPPRM